jgi:hypothetical protein
MQYENWSKDPEITKLYLLEACKLKKDKVYLFLFDDGTGYQGTPLNFVPYLIRRFKVFPDDSFFIESADVEEGRTPWQGELYPPTEAGETPDSDKKDWRF